MKINKILIANRGEIAVRIIKTAQSLGYETVAVFSEADADAPHVSMADQAVLIGPAAVGESYLNMERVLAAAQKSGADAIHPGYGFLSENADFADLVIKHGITWIGPSPESMRIMGNKAAAKELLATQSDVRVPMIPGYSGENQDDETFIKAAEDIGYPIMIKAAAGGGGRGMRLVHKAQALTPELDTARSESLKAFGSDELLIEKAIIEPRHIEVQVFGDQHGNIIHLGERDCSIQRRHQKVFEEAPSPISHLTESKFDGFRKRIGARAGAVARAVNYVGAGTVEFLVDLDGNAYFIEMNTRLQVEHPVTELITGQDLVAWQIAVAEGKPLPLTQDQVALNGHAIEVRLYAEDPDNQFLPSTGPIYYWQPPVGDGVRVDHGLKSGMEITPFYDAMIAKIIAYGETREIAQRRLNRALKNTAVFGLKTNREFLIETNNHPIFSAGEATTKFIEENWNPSEDVASDQMKAIAAVLFNRQLPDRSNILLSNQPVSPWSSTQLVHWSSDSAAWSNRPFTCQLGDDLITVEQDFDETYHVQVDEDVLQIKCLEQSPNTLFFEQDGLRSTAVFAFEPDGDLWLQVDGKCHFFSDSLLNPPENADGEGSGRIVAPMPGAVMRLDVNVGDTVIKGQTLLILEAMKMEHAIPAPFDGTVEEILVVEGQQMQPKELMIVVG
ncbi:MAG: acetyl-CoA carboxylase biotin carboxylase subunit [Chloroflexota bacterium]